MDDLFPYVFVAFVVAFVLFFLFLVFTKKGRGLMLGGRIIRTVKGEIKQRAGIARTVIRVHVIGRKKEPEHRVSIELTQSAILAWSMTPIQLTKPEATKLIAMLSEAVDEGDDTSRGNSSL